MKKVTSIIVVLIIIVIFWVSGVFNNPIENADIVINQPLPGAQISHPLHVYGEARGSWYFEATFPVVLVDWDGRIIAESYAEAGGSWMTEESVPFEAILEFKSPYKEGDPDFMRRGVLILRKANPSGLPQNDDAVEIQVEF